MRILLVSPYDFTYPGGANEHIHFLAAEYRKLGHEVHILAPASAKRPLPAEPGLHAIGRPVPIPANGSSARITLSLRLSGRVKAYLAQIRPDVIHLHEPLMPALPLTVLYHAEVPMVGTFHAFSESNLAYFYGRPLLQRMIERLDARIAVSQPAADFVERYFGGAYQVIPNGIEIGELGAVAPLPEYRDGRPTILFLGRFEEPRKGFRYLLRAFRLVREQFPNARLLVVGGGDIERYREELQRTGAAGIEFTGFVDNAVKSRYYASCDLFCSPAIKGESFGLILLEAMASDRAVVASRIPGHASVLTHGQDGWLVPPQDPVALALALVHLLADRELRERIAASGRLTAERYAWSAIAQRVLAVYNDLLEPTATVAAGNLSAGAR